MSALVMCKQVFNLLIQVGECRSFMGIRLPTGIDDSDIHSLWTRWWTWISEIKEINFVSSSIWSRVRHTLNHSQLHQATTAALVPPVSYQHM